MRNLAELDFGRVDVSGGANEMFDEGQRTKSASEDSGVPIIRTASSETAVVIRHVVGAEAEIKYWDAGGNVIQISLMPGEYAPLGSLRFRHKAI